MVTPTNSVLYCSESYVMPFLHEIYYKTDVTVAVA